MLAYSIIKLIFYAYIQSISFSLVSRSRNRNNIPYHIIASVFSNGVWFLTFRELVVNDMNFALLLPYTLGTVTGSVTGVKVSQWIERKLGAESDSHLKSNNNGK